MFRHFHVFASTLLDRVEMLSQGGERFEIRVHGFAAVEALLARGRGCLLIGSHLGSVEILRAFGERHQRLMINLVMHEGNAQSTSRWLRQMAPELAQRIIAPGEAGTLLRVRECLERGEVVAMLGDRPFGNERTTRCDFLGRRPRFPSGPMLVAGVLGVPVVAFFCLYERDLRYNVALRGAHRARRARRRAARCGARAVDRALRAPARGACAPRALQLVQLLRFLAGRVIAFGALAARCCRGCLAGAAPRGARSSWTP